MFNFEIFISGDPIYFLCRSNTNQSVSNKRQQQAQKYFSWLSFLLILLYFVVFLHFLLFSYVFLVFPVCNAHSLVHLNCCILL